MSTAKLKSKRPLSAVRREAVRVSRSGSTKRRQRSDTKAGVSNSIKAAALSDLESVNGKAVWTSEPDRELGRGRSGIVFQSVDESGRAIARKVFGSSGLAKIVQYAFLGAPNPYAWCESALQTAVLRRRVLAELTAYWFEGRLRVAEAYGHGWNTKLQAYEMHCELIRGRHASLHHPYSQPHDAELTPLTDDIMKPLQDHLMEAGFDGMVWQAGKGNPVALNNFLLENRTEGGDRSWVWIDLESGVPALFPLNPWTLLSFYLPRSFRHHRPLFDDVDLNKLRAYVIQQGPDLLDRLGCQRVRQLGADISKLSRCQEAWKAMRRHQCSIAYRRAKGAISSVEADWYTGHPVRWYGREVARLTRKAPSVVVDGAQRLLISLASIDVRHVLKASWSALRSQTCRERMARDYVSARISRWVDREQLDERDAAKLRAHLETEEASAYLTDFGVHIVVKPLVKLIQFWLLPALWMAGVVDETLLAVFFVAGGSIVRTAYTLGRLVQNACTGRERPWVALGVGTVPVAGNVAFPLQIIATGASEHRAIAQFILYDTFSRLGQWMPIWGGADTRTEHVFNRLPKWLLGARAYASAIDEQPDKPKVASNMTALESCF